MNDHLHPIFREILNSHAYAVTDALEDSRPFSDAAHRWSVVKPCTCGAYPFPHRQNGGYCANWDSEQAERNAEMMADATDLETWAGLSRG